MWGLLFNLITKEASQDIGESIGKVLEVDCKAIVANRARFLCIQVELPLKKPIKRGALVLSPKGDKVWIAFQYERLVGLCFNYGLIGHEARDCHHPISSTEEDKPYGEWLRAGSRVAKGPRGKKQASPPQCNTKRAKDQARDQPQPPREQQMGETNSNVISGELLQVLNLMRINSWRKELMHPM